MANRRIPPWLERYNHELALAIRRGRRLAEQDWVFTPPKTLPRNEREAEARIQRLRNVSQRGLASNRLPSYVKYQTTIPTPFRGRSYQTTPLTQTQVNDLKRVLNIRNTERKKLGLETEPVRIRVGSRERYDELISQYSSPTRTRERLFQENKNFVDNFRKSMSSNLAQLEMMGDLDNEWMQDEFRNIINWIDNNPDRAFQVIYRMTKEYGQAFTFEVFGSEQELLSPYNLKRLVRYWENVI